MDMESGRPKQYMDVKGGLEVYTYLLSQGLKAPDVPPAMSVCILPVSHHAMPSECKRQSIVVMMVPRT